ncbi:MAG: adenine deaminase [Firmicutes bacterium]|nr:adenine deaminase [Bacillota bacterium]
MDHKKKALFSYEKISRQLAAVARGQLPADLVIKNCRLVNVLTGEIEEGVDIAIAAGHFVFIGDAEKCIEVNTKVIRAKGLYLAPGFFDAHLHVESSMVTVTQFARAVLPHGTTAICMDPHEIANVLGIEGVRLMIEEGQALPLRVFATAPSCVPSAPDLEDAGAAVGLEEVEEMLSWESVLGLGEMMNFPGVLQGEEKIHKMLEITREKRKVITGHFPLPDTASSLQAYIAAGISSCHESTRRQEVLAKLRRGMYAMIREGSAWQDLEETIKSVTENKVDTWRCLLVSDDTHPRDLLQRGHMDYIVRKAISCGLSPLKAYQMATINPARYFGLEEKLGCIAPGRQADFLLLSDLAGVKVEQVFIAGKKVAEAGKLTREVTGAAYPSSVFNTVLIASRLQASDFVMPAPEGKKEARATVIKVEEASALTKKIEMNVNFAGDLILTAGSDLAKLAVIERHGKKQGMALGLVSGFGLQKGAVASTVAHDSHNLIIMGTNNEDMALAGNILQQEGGGLVAVQEGKVLALVKLPVAGLLSTQSVEEVAAGLQQLETAFHELKCTLHAPFMTLSLLSLPVIPEIRLSNRGLVDVSKNCLIPVFS